jgi:hypothetical protein
MGSGATNTAAGAKDMSAKTFEVGQELWFVPRWGKLSECHALKITKVGRKWLELSNGRRACVNTLETGYDRCYLSQADHENQREIFIAWQKLGGLIERRKPEGVTLDDIAQARKLLGLDPKP